MIGAAVPALTLVLATIVAVLPWGFGHLADFGFAMLPMIVVHYWSLRRPRHLPVSLVFACGLAIDVMTHGPLGFWALLALVSVAAAPAPDRDTFASTIAGRYGHSILAMGVVALVGWVLMSIYFQRVIDWQPMAFGVGASVLLYPIVAFALLRVGRFAEAAPARAFARKD
jgi:rod shape-determining protein MreD